MNGLLSRCDVFQRCCDHMVQAVQQAEFSDDPFPHFLVQSFFPREIYEQIERLLPARESYVPFEYSGTEPQTAARWRCDLKARSLAQLTPEVREFWLAIRDALGCQALKRAVFQKLAPGLAYRYGVRREAAADLPGYPLPALFREQLGYRIKPHPDTRKKVVTMQIALPVDDSQQHIGTQFYRRSPSPLSLLREPRGFEIVKTAPFLPNAAYAFVVLNTLGRKSWHGRTTLAQQDGIRNSILNIYHEKAEHGHPEIEADHDEPLRAAA